MHYTSIFLAALSATTTLAAPSQGPPHDNKLQVTLNGPHTSPAKNTFPEFPRTAQQPSPNGPLNSVELHVGKSVRNPASRCQILDTAGKPIVLQRGPKTDITFADGDKGKWTFRDQSSKISQIICDPSFRQLSAGSSSDILVQLSDQGSELKIQAAFTEGQRQEKAVNPGPFTAVEVMVGPWVRKQDYPCEVIDKGGRAIVATRGANRDTTSSDAGKGEWTPEKESEVSKVVCDPAFKAAPAASG
ncbi:MAG: hypothetical protein Q9199_002581 [Rusavskia elegans]